MSREFENGPVEGLHVACAVLPLHHPCTDRRTFAKHMEERHHAGRRPGLTECGGLSGGSSSVSEGSWVLVVAVLLASAFGIYRGISDGRFRGTRKLRGAVGQEHDAGVLAGADIDGDLGERATLLQFSSAFCAPCRATRRVLGDVAAVVPGVTHVEVDAEHHLELVRRLGIVRTPTTLVLDAHGREVTRASGAPRKEEVLTALARAVER